MNMKRLNALLITLIACSPALAAPQLYVCERPAWDGKEGCGPNNTYATYTFLVETNDFDKEKPEYVFQGGKGCDVSKKVKYRYHYVVSEDSMTFKFAELPKAPRDKLWTTIKLDRNTMKAVLNDTDNSPELSCRLETPED
jgi:hypothetical protein